MFDDNRLSQRELYYGKELHRNAIIKKVVQGLQIAYVGTVLAFGAIPAANAMELASANYNYNKAVEYNISGDTQKSEEVLDAMSSRLVSKQNRAQFSEMTYEEKLSYIESLLSRWMDEEKTMAPAGLVGMLAVVLLSKVNNEIEQKVDEDFDRTLYELYLDEKCSPQFKSDLRKKDMEEIAERISGDAETSKKQAEDIISQRSFSDDKPVSYNDYNLGFKNGQYDFYSRCNYGSGNIYNKAIKYVEKGLSADKIDKKLVEIAYKKGYYRSAGLYVAEKFAMGEELCEEEYEIFDNMDNLSLKNILHIDKYSATEVKNRKDYWYGYCDGFVNEVNCPYSSIDYDLSGLEPDVKEAIDSSLDTNSYKYAFYRGVIDGVRDLNKRVEQKKALQQEQNI